MNKGIVFSIEVLLTIASVLIILSGIVLLTSQHSPRLDLKPWQQAKALLNTQTKLITNSTLQSLSQVQSGGNDYYCYSLWGRISENDLSMEEKQHCEETP